MGSHTVEVKATDAAGRLSAKTLTINIARDTTAPEVSYLGALYSAPSGWLEQKKVTYAAIAKGLELHLWPSGSIDRLRLGSLPADPC